LRRRWWRRRNTDLGLVILFFCHSTITSTVYLLVAEEALTPLKRKEANEKEQNLFIEQRVIDLKVFTMDYSIRFCVLSNIPSTSILQLFNVKDSEFS
jgi:hypothetical protein